MSVLWRNWYSLSQNYRISIITRWRLLDVNFKLISIVSPYELMLWPLINPITLWMAKTPISFGHSGCYRRIKIALPMYISSKKWEELSQDGHQICSVSRALSLSALLCALFQHVSVESKGQSVTYVRTGEDSVSVNPIMWDKTVRGVLQASTNILTAVVSISLTIHFSHLKLCKSVFYCNFICLTKVQQPDWISVKKKKVSLL